MNSVKKYPRLTNAKIEERLKAAGIRPTAQRIAISRYVLSKPIHPTIEEVKSWVDKNFPKMSLATVYNTLSAMVNGGMLKTLKFAHTDKVMFDNNTGPHYHFLDATTNEIYDIPSENLSIDMSLPSEFDVEEVELLVIGRIKR